VILSKHVGKRGGGEWRCERKEGKVTQAHDRASGIELARKRERERERERERYIQREGEGEGGGDGEGEEEGDVLGERGGGGETTHAYEREGAPSNARTIKRKQTT